MICEIRKLNSDTSEEELLGTVELVDGKLVAKPEKYSYLLQSGELDPETNPEAFLRNLHREYCGTYFWCTKAV